MIAASSDRFLYRVCKSEQLTPGSGRSLTRVRSEDNTLSAELLSSNDCLFRVPFEVLQAQQGLVAGGDVGTLWGQEYHPLIGPTPFVV